MPNSQDELQRKRLAQSILASCAAKHGGVDALSRYLGVPQEEVLGWLGGRSDPPVEVVQKAIEPFVKPEQ